MLSTILASIEASTEELLHLQRHLVSIPALGPTNDGQGESRKVDFLHAYLARFPELEIQRIEAPDSRVPSGVRPSLAARFPGHSSQTLWLIAHTDVVPAGDLGLWNTDPFVLHQQGDLVFGRGVEDNHQGLVSALLLLRAVALSGTKPPLSLGVLMAADEETGNAYGMEYILRNHENLVAPDDLVVIPDFGSPNGDAIEIAEKSVLWLKFSIQGKQCHASTPAQGVNTLIGSAALILALDSLHARFDRHDPLFDPPYSTFVPTKKEANVPNVNTIPGLDIFYIDCRILPCYALDEVEQSVREICAAVETERGVRITMEPVVREQAAPGTSIESPVVLKLQQAISAMRDTQAQTIGIGGGTVAASFRKRSRTAVCWSTLLNTAHQPNEYSSIINTLNDSKVFAHMLCTVDAQS